MEEVRTVNVCLECGLFCLSQKSQISPSLQKNSNVDKDLGENPHPSDYRAFAHILFVVPHVHSIVPACI